MIVMRQKRVLWVPARVFLVVLTGKTSSLVSLVIFITTVVASLGNPSSSTFASPGNGVAWLILATTSVDFPCSVAAFSIETVTNWEAISSVANWVETQAVPPALALPKA